MICVPCCISIFDFALKKSQEHFGGSLNCNWCLISIDSFCGWDYQGVFGNRSHKSTMGFRALKVVLTDFFMLLLFCHTAMFLFWIFKQIFSKDFLLTSRSHGFVNHTKSRRSLVGLQKMFQVVLRIIETFLGKCAVHPWIFFFFDG